ncbi:NADPH:quinone oxidoreductase family protein [Ottowia thiooxydans]|uniref:NADPH:quinone oxidoreductase family protein n=1 Tax=Ottowia thiooxydans TaxID=219182 RepID=UPI00041BD689|nr:NADPH:quinone oxidoreductase family protein [Ottowia thiooxydans]
MTQVFPAGKRVVVTEYAESPQEAIEKFVHLVEQPAPDPASLKPHEVIVAIRSVAVAWVDLLMTSGQYQHMAPLPYTPGMEYAGDVLAVGSEVDPARCAVGDRVLADPMKIGPRSYGDYQGAGGFASYAVLPVDGVMKIPAELSYDDATGMLQAYETAYHCLVARGQLQSGETVLINGATGLTGLAAVQVAKLLGATVIATGRSDAKLATVKEQGADHVVNILGPDKEVREFRKDVKELTGGQGVEVVYDAVGGEVSNESLRCMAFGGRFLIVGWTSTPNVARGKGLRGAPNVNTLPTNIIQMKSLSVMGCPAVIAIAKDPSIRVPRLEAIFKWVKEGKIRPHVSHTYPLADYKKAMLARWNGEVTGGCVLHP